MTRPDGFELSLRASALRHQLARDHLIFGLRECLQLYDTETDEDEALSDAAEHVLLVLEHAGIELVFDDGGKFKFVVT